MEEFNMENREHLICLHILVKSCAFLCVYIYIYIHIYIYLFLRDAKAIIFYSNLTGFKNNERRMRLKNLFRFMQSGGHVLLKPGVENFKHYFTQSPGLQGGPTSAS